MQNEESIEKLCTINDSNFTILHRKPFRRLKVYRIRKNLLILLIILFVLNLIYLIFIVHAYIDHLWFSQYFENNYELLWTLVLIIYDVFGLVVTSRYYRTGLRVFAWIGTIFLIFICIFAGIILITAYHTTKKVNTIDVDIIGPLIFIIIFISSAIVLLIIVLLSFKLSKLIIHN